MKKGPKAIVIIIILISVFGYLYLKPTVQEAPKFTNQTNAFTEHLKVLVPTLLENRPAPGIAIALIENGQVVYKKGFGLAIVAEGQEVAADTVFNIGSISKTLTGWGVMRLVEEGLINLDDPISDYVPGLIKGEGFDLKGVTIRRILSHTAGLSLSAVPEYGPDETLPNLLDAIKNPETGVHLIAEPGAGWSYSGGGYMVLQYLIEEVSGQPFSTYMKENVLDPLGMENSSFTWEEALLAKAARGYDEGKAVPNFRYVGEAAASLNSSLDDMALFISHNATPGLGNGVLKQATLEMMRSPVENAAQRFGQRYGLGYDIWGLAKGKPLVGHNGQNTGWGAAAWFSPVDNDGLVILTNHSDGDDSYKWILCDWVKWKADTVWPGMCTNRPEFLPPLPTFEGDQIENEAVNALFQAYDREDSPGATVLISRNGDIIFQGNYGLADIETGRPITSDNIFYLASVSKQFTAAAVLKLVERGQINLEENLAPYFPELGEKASRITIKNLLTHTSGLPDFHQFYRWSPGFRLSNGDVYNFLIENPELDFEPGEKYQYSNSGYVLLALLIEQVSGQSLEYFLSEHFLAPLQMTKTSLYDTLGEPLPLRAYGYRKSEDEFVPFDYFTLRYGDGTREPVGYTTTGAGGMYSTSLDLSRWVQSLDFSSPAFSPQVGLGDDQGIPGTTHYGYGWLMGKIAGERMVWHDGGMVGFSNTILILPERGISIIILSNLNGSPTRKLASDIAELFVSGDLS